VFDPDNINRSLSRIWRLRIDEAPTHVRDSPGREGITWIRDEIGAEENYKRAILDGRVVDEWSDVNNVLGRIKYLDHGRAFRCVVYTDSNCASHEAAGQQCGERERARRDWGFSS